MSVHNVPRNKWVEFCNVFKRRHRGWLATVTVCHENEKREAVAENIALQDIIVNISNHRQDEVKIILGKSPERGLVHQIKEPLSLQLEQTSEGAPKAFKIEDLSGLTTVLKFRSEVLPEMVDGIVLN